MRGTETKGGAWSKAGVATITDYFSSGAVWYKENADMIIVLLKDLTLNKSTAEAGSVEFATGLPQPDGSYVFLLTDYQGARTMRCAYKSDGKLYIHYAGSVAPSDIQFYGQVIAFKR